MQGARHGNTIATGWCRGLSPTKAQLGSEEISDTASGCRILGHGSRCRVVGSIASQFLVMEGGTPKSGRTKEKSH
ncbi:hypothetical protein D8674_010706 [Pyrus ussuriensis x Pyrus communis]|uniref:Uncharacterized protein n=1 Tax=Pyrus ussuriensis x Pyrus communis TaxID=2448454 RepID=A0A5N5FBI5_9ROSA|nr:hypothetical protein D8674_010706 [Pyrus ussuriensis x Pyrus communis]